MKPINELTFDDMYQMERDGEFENKVPYPKTAPVLAVHTFDENQSVRWNREKAEAHNAEIKNQHDAYKKGVGEAFNFFYDCLVAAIMQDTGLVKEKSQKIYNKAYEDGHSGGFSEVISHASELCDFVTDILK